MAQGFTRNLNLQESSSPSSDRAVFNNLVSPGIAFDIALFDGNTKFKGELLNNSSSSRVDFEVFNDPFDGYTVRIVAEAKVAFTNNTIISIDGGANYLYKVVNGNDQDLFQLQTISDTSIYNFDGLNISNLTLTRDDTLYASNFNNLQPLRISTVGTSDGSGDTGSDSEVNDVGTVGVDPYTQIESIDIALSEFTEKQRKIPLTYKNNTFDTKIRLNGAIRLENNLNSPDTLRVKVGNDSEFGEFVIGQAYKIVALGASDWASVGWIANSTTVGATTGADPAEGDKFIATGKGSANALSTARSFQPPGLYIINTATGQSTRAFSGSINPWSKVTNTTITAGAGVAELNIGGALKTESNISQPTNLILEPSDNNVDPEILITDTASARAFVSGTTTENITESEYTHKIPVTINGEQFFFLSKKGETAAGKTEYKALLGT